MITIKKTLAWLGLFACLFTAQIATYPFPEESGNIPESTINLIKNASIPIFLSENQNASARQLENLIQDTDIQEIRIYSSDQRPIETIINSRIPESAKPNLIESFPVIFQGTLAGNIQLEVIDSSPDFAIQSALIPMFFVSLVLSVFAWMVVASYQFFAAHKKSFRASADSYESIELEDNSVISDGSSLLLYVIPTSTPQLDEDPEIKKKIYNGFFQRIETHLQLYGGKALSFSDDRMVCRLPSGQSSQDTQQAMMFTWGTAQPLKYRFHRKEYQIQCNTLLHKTLTAAKQGNLYRALSEVGEETLKLVMQSKGAHLSQNLYESINQDSGFSTRKLDQNLGIYSIQSISKSLAELWTKQTRAFGNQSDT